MSNLKLRGFQAAVAVIALVAGLTSMEGNKPIPYKDTSGVWTACVGDTREIDPSHIYTPQECQDRLVSQLHRHNEGLLKCMPALADSPDHFHGAILDLGYNVGVGAVCNSSIRKKVQDHNATGACQVITDFYKAAGKDCRVRSNGCYGVWRRRLWERAMCEGKLTNEQIAKGFAGLED